MINCSIPKIKRICHIPDENCFINLRHTNGKRKNICNRNFGEYEISNGYTGLCKCISKNRIKKMIPFYANSVERKKKKNKVNSIYQKKCTTPSYCKDLYNYSEKGKIKGKTTILKNADSYKKGSYELRNKYINNVHSKSLNSCRKQEINNESYKCKMCKDENTTDRRRMDKDITVKGIGISEDASHSTQHDAKYEENNDEKYYEERRKQEEYIKRIQMNSPNKHILSKEIQSGKVREKNYPNLSKCKETDKEKNFEFLINTKAVKEENKNSNSNSKIPSNEILFSGNIYRMGHINEKGKTGKRQNTGRNVPERKTILSKVRRRSTPKKGKSSINGEKKNSEKFYKSSKKNREHSSSFSKESSLYEVSLLGEMDISFDLSSNEDGKSFSRNFKNASSENAANGGGSSGDGSSGGGSSGGGINGGDAKGKGIQAGSAVARHEAPKREAAELGAVQGKERNREGAHNQKIAHGGMKYTDLGKLKYDEIRSNRLVEGRSANSGNVQVKSSSNGGEFFIVYTDDEHEGTIREEKKERTRKIYCAKQNYEHVTQERSRILGDNIRRDSKKVNKKSEISPFRGGKKVGNTKLFVKERQKKEVEKRKEKICIHDNENSVVGGKRKTDLVEFTDRSLSRENSERAKQMQKKRVTTSAENDTKYDFSPAVSNISNEKGSTLYSRPMCNDLSRNVSTTESCNDVFYDKKKSNIFLEDILEFIHNRKMETECYVNRDNIYQDHFYFKKGNNMHYEEGEKKTHNLNITNDFNQNEEEKRDIFHISNIPETEMEDSHSNGYSSDIISNEKKEKTEHNKNYPTHCSSNGKTNHCSFTNKGVKKNVGNKKFLYNDVIKNWDKIPVCEKTSALKKKKTNETCNGRHFDIKEEMKTLTNLLNLKNEQNERLKIFLQLQENEINFLREKLQLFCGNTKEKKKSWENTTIYKNLIKANPSSFLEIILKNSQQIENDDFANNARTLKREDYDNCINRNDVPSPNAYEVRVTGENNSPRFHKTYDCAVKDAYMDVHIGGREVRRDGADFHDNAGVNTFNADEKHALREQSNLKKKDMHALKIFEDAEMINRDYSTNQRHVLGEKSCRCRPKTESAPPIGHRAKETISSESTKALTGYTNGSNNRSGDMRCSDNRGSSRFFGGRTHSERDRGRSKTHVINFNSRKGKREIAPWQSSSCLGPCRFPRLEAKNCNSFSYCNGRCKCNKDQSKMPKKTFKSNVVSVRCLPKNVKNMTWSCKNCSCSPKNLCAKKESGKERSESIFSKVFSYIRRNSLCNEKKYGNSCRRNNSARSAVFTQKRESSTPGCKRSSSSGYFIDVYPAKFQKRNYLHLCNGKRILINGKNGATNALLGAKGGADIFEDGKTKGENATRCCKKVKTGEKENAERDVYDARDACEQTGENAPYFNISCRSKPTMKGGTTKERTTKGAATIKRGIIKSNCRYVLKRNDDNPLDPYARGEVLKNNESKHMKNVKEVGHNARRVNNLDSQQNANPNLLNGRRLEGGHFLKKEEVPGMSDITEKAKLKYYSVKRCSKLDSTEMENTKKDTEQLGKTKRRIGETSGIVYTRVGAKGPKTNNSVDQKSVNQENATDNFAFSCKNKKNCQAVRKNDQTDVIFKKNDHFSPEGNTLSHDSGIQVKQKKTYKTVGVKKGNNGMCVTKKEFSNCSKESNDMFRKNKNIADMQYEKSKKQLEKKKNMHICGASHLDSVNGTSSNITERGTLDDYSTCSNEDIYLWNTKENTKEKKNVLASEVIEIGDLNKQIKGRFNVQLLNSNGELTGSAENIIKKVILNYKTFKMRQKKQYKLGDESQSNVECNCDTCDFLQNQKKKKGQLGISGVCVGTHNGLNKKTDSGVNRKTNSCVNIKTDNWVNEKAQSMRAEKRQGCSSVTMDKNCGADDTRDVNENTYERSWKKNNSVINHAPYSGRDCVYPDPKIYFLKNDESSIIVEYPNIKYYIKCH
ncbi:conserved Plasmodium protein, unknown function [Plasmodium ovale]|uniref:Uncharacterized protein n=1 Tax=Plasmodium ovale TaxID=36330 RepID=A0A1C3KXS4_PLAOA|nr:conserved Plasmodium protein, unknown function [Plasmodium ovale]